jgi:metal-responsive CopG/Arc/MetJ family transcriptional regulator
MGVVKIGISLPDSLLEKVDTIARRKGVSRSEFVRQSLERTLAEESSPRILAEARALYAAVEEDDLETADDFLTAAADTLPTYEEPET